MSHPAPDHQTRERLPWPDRLIETGVLFLLVFTPLAYGTVEPWSEAIAGLVVLGMAVTWMLQMVLCHWELRAELPPGWLPGSLFLVLVFVQAVALPSGLVERLSPLSASLARDAFAYTGTHGSAVPISLDPHATWREGLKLAAVAAFFLICYNTYCTRAQVRRALWTMIIMGTVISVFGIVQRMTWNGRFYWIGPEAPHASAFGPFVNRTHFAGLMAVVVPMALALVLAGRPENSRRRMIGGWRDRLRHWNSRGTGPISLIPFLIFLMGGAALVAGSRGGVVALIAALLVMVGLGARGRSGTGRAARIALATILIVLAGVWIGGDILYGTIERLAKEVGQPEASDRVHIWRDALTLLQAAPALGTGYATFGTVFPAVRTLQAPVAFTHAESDWIQLLTDTGMVGLALVLGAAGALGLGLLRRYRDPESPLSRTLALAGLVALVGTAVQGIGNYNLPVLSSWIYLALAVALAARTGQERGIS